MRIAKAAHLLVLAIAFVTLIAVTSALLDDGSGTVLQVQNGTDLLVQVGVFVYLMLALCLLAYALKRRFSPPRSFRWSKR